MNIQPLHDWLIIELEPAPERKGCIILPDPDNEPLRIGKVLRAGPGRQHPNSNAFRPMMVKEGDRVVFPMAVTECGSGRNITHALDDNKLRMIRETDIFFVVEGNLRIEV